MASQDCQVCLECYDDEARKPRCLSCGHTLCTLCVADIIERGALYCPFCRVSHVSPVTRAEDVPVNYTLVSLLQDSGLVMAPRSAEALLSVVKTEAIERTTGQLVICNCHLARLKDLQQRLGAQTKLQEKHIHALRSLLARHEEHLRDLNDASARTREAEGEGEGWKRALELSQARVNCAASLLEVTAVHQEDGALEASVKGWSEKAYELLKTQVVQAAEEMESITRVALEAVVERSMTTTASAVTPTKYQVSYESDKSLLISEVLRKARVVGSEVWAVLDEDGRPRCAKVTQVDGRICLHALIEGTPPIYSHTVSYEDVRNLVDDTCIRTFLELSWAGKVQGRVTIRLLNATCRCLQFFYLCTGERGPSYANTRLLETEARGQSGERVWGGDYQNNDGSGGAALPGLTMGELSSQSVTAGLVAGFCYSHEHRNPSHFVIYNNDCPILYEESPLGRVVEGLELVRSAARLPDVKDAVVSDCGLVLS
ncbi:uncharacterized protein [Penaeus vannamei]|uniref:uncharacterized protein isoform X2 n=1 Tax=Penaeus vannamei TaxID=6689 RepID=UPI00387F549C